MILVFIIFIIELGKMSYKKPAFLGGGRGRGRGRGTEKERIGQQVSYFYHQFYLPEHFGFTS